MSRPSPSAFPDCEAAFAAALRHGTIHLDFPEARKATTFAARCNRYRKLLRDNARDLGHPAVSPYDGITIRHPRRGKRLIFEPRMEDFTIRTADGTPLDLALPTPPTSSEAASAPSTPPEPLDDEVTDFLNEFTASLPPLKETPDEN